MLAPSTTQVLEDHSYVAEYDERWRKDRTFMEGHNELVALKFPHLVGDGLDLEECITTDNHRQRRHTSRERLHLL